MESSNGEVIDIHPNGSSPVGRIVLRVVLGSWGGCVCVWGGDMNNSKRVEERKMHQNKTVTVYIIVDTLL